MQLSLLIGKRDPFNTHGHNWGTCCPSCCLNLTTLGPLLKFKTEALKYELHTLMFVEPTPLPPNTCNCAMHSCMRKRYFLWCAHFLTTRSKYLSLPHAIWKGIRFSCLGEVVGYNLKMERCTFQLFLGAGGYNQKMERYIYISIIWGWSLQFRDGTV